MKKELHHCRIYVFIIFSVVFLSSSEIISNYYSPSNGAQIVVKRSRCSTKCYVNSKMTWGNRFKIPLSEKTSIKITAKHYLSDGYYFSSFEYDLEADSLDASGEIDDIYEGDGKFKNNISSNGITM
jgi:hypothetical protein